MGGPRKKTPAEELIASLLKDVGESADSNDQYSDAPSTDIHGIRQDDPEDQGFIMAGSENNDNSYAEATECEFESTRSRERPEIPDEIELSGDGGDLHEAMGQLQHEQNAVAGPDSTQPFDLAEAAPPALEVKSDDNFKTQLVALEPAIPTVAAPNPMVSDSDKTVAVAGYQMRSEDYGDKIKVTVGQNRTGYSAWNNGGAAESNLGQAENLRMAQEKILEIERENEKLRLQNEELMAASEIIKERSDLLSAQLSEYRRDRDGLEESFKNEIVLLKNHLARKDTELQRAQFKTDELDSRLKFDMKKIRVRERELENRLELIRAEKNAIVKNKDEQILDLRRKMDVLQMEVESYRQKCVELNKSLETNQESFKRTTRALRLAMANLELQEENKVPLKKVD